MKQMKQYRQLDAAGQVFQTPDGRTSFFAAADSSDYADMLAEVTAGEAEILPYVEPPDTRTYREKRKLEYPSIGDQLDTIWHAMDIGLLTTVPDFYDPINTIKQKYPKL